MSRLRFLEGTRASRDKDGWHIDCRFGLFGPIRPHHLEGSLAGSQNNDGATSVCDRIAPLSDVLTVDVEDYYQVEAFADQVSPDSWPDFPSRVRSNTKRVLEVFEEHGCRGTFFILGWVAKKHPELVREIVAAGHEIACHSYAHRRISSLSPEEFHQDLRRARTAIEDAAGVRVLGYRAPTFSIGPHNLWALEILADEGFVYDSSIFPIRHDLYGYPGAPRFAHTFDLKSKRKLLEIPMTTVRVAGWNWPVGGGGYLRLLPMQYTRWAIDRVHKRENQPVILYFHPWELDPEQPRIPGKWKSRARHYIGLKSMERRLRELLSRGTYLPMIDLVRRLSSPDLPPIGATAVSNLTT